MSTNSADATLAADADLAACRDILASGSRSFHAASLLLPPKMRAAATALYAFCRLADDAVDQPADGVPGLAALRERLERIYEGRPMALAADRAFAEVVRDHAIPKDLPAALLEGFEWDAAGRRYETLAELNAYGARVAGTVGAMMALLMGARDADVIARACDLGCAMQLTNIARDVGEDAAMGRVYLPLEWLREAGIDPDAWLARPVFSPALGGVVGRLLEAAEELYARARPAIAHLPLACRPGMHAARLVYAGIGREVVRRGLDSVSGRAYVRPARKVLVLGQALVEAFAFGGAVGAPALEQTRFLVEAADQALKSARREVAPSGAGIEGRVLWVLDLFERLERRDAAVAAAGPSARA